MMMMMARSLLLSPFPGWVTAHSSPPLLSAAALPHTPTHTLPYIAPVHCPIHCPNPPQLSYHSLRRPIRHSLLKWWTDSPPIHWSAQKWLEEICGAYNLIIYFCNNLEFSVCFCGAMSLCCPKLWSQVCSASQKTAAPSKVNTLGKLFFYLEKCEMCGGFKIWSLGRDSYGIIRLTF